MMRRHGAGGLVLSLVTALTAGCHRQQGAETLPPLPPEQVAAQPANQDATQGQQVAHAEPEAPPAAVDEDPDAPLHEAVVGSPAAYEAFANEAPPAPADEARPDAPDPAMQWIPGYWWYSQKLGQYIWITGAWRAAPPDTSWVAGSWNLTDGHYAWTPGFWAPAGYRPDAAFLNEAPPAPIAETIIESTRPGADYAWVPGSYEIRGGSYVWVGGRWGHAPIVGSAWVEPRYVRVGGRYVYTPGRWDYAVERRGVAYRPVVGVRAGVRVTPVAVRADVVARHASYQEHVAARVRTHAAVSANASVHASGHVEAHSEHAGGTAHATEHAGGTAHAGGDAHSNAHDASHEHHDDHAKPAHEQHPEPAKPHSEPAKSTQKAQPAKPTEAPKKKESEPAKKKPEPPKKKEPEKKK